MPAAPPRILFVDDSEDDVLLAAARLKRALPGCRVDRVDTAESLAAALGSRTWQAVVCERELPRLDAGRALALVRAIDAAVPFVLFAARRGPEAWRSDEQLEASARVDKLDVDKLAKVIAALLAPAVPSAAVPRPRREPVAAESLVLLAQPIAAMQLERAWGAELQVRRRAGAAAGPVDLESPLLKPTADASTVAEWLLARAIEAAAALHRETPRDFRIAVAAPRSLLERPEPAEALRRALAEGLVPTGVVEVSVAEGWVMRQPENTRLIAAALRRGGVRVAIDHFGTTYGPLAPLQAIAPDTLRMAPSLVRDAQAGREAAIEGAIALARALGARVLAAGVETESDARRLAALGVDRAQGPLSPAQPLASAGALVAFANALLGSAPRAAGSEGKRSRSSGQG